MSITTKSISFEYLNIIIASVSKNDDLAAETRLKVIKALLEEMTA